VVLALSDLNFDFSPGMLDASALGTSYQKSSPQLLVFIA
jgi:hypothetical protein